MVHLKGPFTRSGGLQAGVDYVKDPDAIVMTIDMHLTFPVGTVEYVRKVSAWVLVVRLLSVFYLRVCVHV